MDWRSRHVLMLLAKNIQVCMDGCGRLFDNIIAERLRRTVKYEKVYLGDFQSVHDAYAELKTYFESCNLERLH